MLARADVDPLVKEQAQIDARRTRFAERTTRILDAKARTMGVDAGSLAAQVEEKQRREQAELERDAYFNGKMNEHAEVLKRLEAERVRQQRLRDLEDQSFHASQADESRRRLAHEEATRKMPIADDSQWLNFKGVDPNADARIAAQKEQQQTWLTAQLAIQAAREERERAEVARFEHAQLTAQAQLEALHRDKEESDKADRRALAQTHLSQAEEAHLRREFLKAQEARASAAEIEAQRTSAMLNELGQQRRDNAARPIPAEFKGFTQSQRQEVLDVQQRQTEEVRMRRERELQENAAWAAQSESDRRKLLALHREQQANRVMAATALAKTHQNQAQEQALRQEYVNRVVNSNPVEEEFFGQFGTSCR